MGNQTKERIITAAEQNPITGMPTMRPQTLQGNFIKLKDVADEEIIITEVKFLDHPQYGPYFVATVQRPSVDTEVYQLLGSAKVIYSALQEWNQSPGWPAAVTFTQHWNQDGSRQYWAIANPGEDVTTDLFAE